MEVEFDDADLDRLETDPKFTAGFSQPIVKGFRKVMQAIRAVADEKDLHQLRGLRFKKLQGDRKHQYSLRINDQWRLIIEVHETALMKTIRVIEITDYH